MNEYLVTYLDQESFELVNRLVFAESLSNAAAKLANEGKEVITIKPLNSVNGSTA